MSYRASALSIAERLNRLPATPTHRAATIIAGIGSFFDLFDIFLAGVLGTVLTSRFQLDRVSLPLVLGSSFLGMFVGAALLGDFADRRGRRPAFLANLGVYSGFTLAGAFSVNAPMLIATRFLAGIGIGAELPLVDTYLSELLPARLRGRYTAWAYTLGFAGVPAAGLLGRLLVPRAPLGISGWRWLFVAGSLGAAIVWAVRGRLPESPRWLESVGRAAEAEALVARMEREASIDLRQRSLAAAGDAPVSQPPEAAGTLLPDGPSGRELHPHAAAVGTGPAPATGVRGTRRLAVLRAPQYRARALMLAVFQIFQTVGYYGFGTLAPTVLAAKGYPVVTSLSFTALTFIGYPIGSALSLPIIERTDRRWLIAGSAFLMSVFGLALGFSSSSAAIVAAGFLYTVASNFFSNGFHVLQAEIFPTSVRATASGAAYGLSRLSSGAMPFLLLPVLERWGAGAMFAVVAGALWIVMIDVALFAPRTTGLGLEVVNR